MCFLSKFMLSVFSSQSGDFIQHICKKALIEFVKVTVIFLYIAFQLALC